MLQQSADVKIEIERYTKGIKRLDIDRMMMRMAARQLGLAQHHSGHRAASEDKTKGDTGKAMRIEQGWPYLMMPSLNEQGQLKYKFVPTEPE